MLPSLECCPDVDVGIKRLGSILARSHVISPLVPFRLDCNPTEASHSTKFCPASTAQTSDNTTKRIEPRPFFPTDLDNPLNKPKWPRSRESDLDLPRHGTNVDANSSFRGVWKWNMLSQHLRTTKNRRLHEKSAKTEHMSTHAKQLILKSDESRERLRKDSNWAIERDGPGKTAKDHNIWRGKFWLTELFVQSWCPRWQAQDDPRSPRVGSSATPRLNFAIARLEDKSTADLEQG